MISSTAPCATYRLADHVRACRLGGQIVLLDLKVGRYIGLAGRALSAWEFPSAETWPVDAGNASLQFADDDSSSWMVPLISQGLLVGGRARQPSVEAVLSEPLMSLNAESYSLRSAPGMRHLMSLWASATVASLWLRYLSLAAIATRVARLRPPAPECCEVPPEAMRAAVAAYVRARPFAYTAHDKCLLDSLSLVHFLAARGFHAQWVVGVGTRPFHAHSWLQYGHVVLNDAHEHVRRHRPILVV